MIISILGISLRAIRRNLLRSFLTILGIVIGVAAVIAMVTLGRGATARVTADIAKLGRNLLIVAPGSDRRSSTTASARPFTMADLKAIQEQIPYVSEVAPSVGSAVRVVSSNRNYGTGLTGTNNSYFHVREWQIALGREFTEAEIRSGSSACILGETVRQELFGAGNPIDSTIRISNISCRIVGVLQPKGRSTFGEDQDDFIVIPLMTFQRRISGNDNIGAIFVSALSEDVTEEAQSSIEALLRQRRRVHEGDEDDFVVRDLREVTSIAQKVTSVLTMLLGAIAAVSLLVGGIGIMNIMLVSVTERTREIGIRMAIGATQNDVLFQFLVEAIVLSIFGGIIGVILGLIGSWGATKAMSMPFVPTIDIIFGSFGFALFVGVFFGYWPARKAAKLNPIDALRFE